MIRPARRLSKPDLRRALQLLAASADGYTEGLLRAHGVTTELAQVADHGRWGGRCSTGQSHEKAHVRAPHLRGPSHEMVG